MMATVGRSERKRLARAADTLLTLDVTQEEGPTSVLQDMETSEAPTPLEQDLEATAAAKEKKKPILVIQTGLAAVHIDS